MTIFDLLTKRLERGGGRLAPTRLPLRSLCSIGLLFLLFGGNAASALDYKLDYGIDAGSASDEGVVACTTGRPCVADVKSLGVMIGVSVSASDGNIMVHGVSERRNIRDCCFFGDGERIASINVDGAITKIPIFSYVGRTGEQFEKLGVLYLRILKPRSKRHIQREKSLWPTVLQLLKRTGLGFKIESTNHWTTY